MGRVKTGIHKLDKQIQGGFKEKSTNIVVGDAGAGKTIFAMQFLLEGLKNGESCVYITFEEDKDKLFDDMSAFGWKLKEFEKKNKLFFFQYSPEQIKSIVEEGGGTLDQLIKKKKVTRLVIDSITLFALLYQDDLPRKEAGLALFDLMSSWGCTSILTSQTIPNSYEDEGAYLGFEADSIIILYHNKVKGERVRALEILKMRGTDHTNKTMSMKISKDGVSVQPNVVRK